MTIRYRLQSDDYWRFAKYSTFQRRIRPIFVYVLFALLILACVFCIWDVIKHWWHYGTVDLFPLIAPAVVVLYPWVFRTLVMQRAKASLAFGEECTLTIEEQHIITSARSIESKLGWAAIHEVIGTKDDIYIYVTKSYAVILPKRVFSTQAEADLFLATAINYKRSAVPGLSLGGEADAGSWPPPPRLGA